MAYFTAPLLAALARESGLELTAYSNSLADDAVTAGLRRHFRRWRRVADMPDAALAEQIAADGIDILIDLSGHTRGNRLLTFARKPAPIQCGWIGYLGTSGLESVDYYLADPYFLPLNEFQPLFTEKLLHIPVVTPFQPAAAAPAVEPPPAIASGRFTFGSFARPMKLNPQTIALWSQLLTALPNSRLLLGALPLDHDPGPVAKAFAANGVARDRLDFLRTCSLEGYLGAHHRIDLCLDPLPYTGATTTCHALWMGVPTLTLAGKTPAGRLGQALLAHCGLAAFIAKDTSGFLEKGMEWAGNVDGLVELPARCAPVFSNRRSTSRKASQPIGVARCARSGQPGARVDSSMQAGLPEVQNSSRCPMSSFAGCHRFGFVNPKPKGNGATARRVQARSSRAALSAVLRLQQSQALVQLVVRGRRTSRLLFALRRDLFIQARHDHHVRSDRLILNLLARRRFVFRH